MRVQHEPIFTPLHFRNLSVKNRIFRSNIAGRFDHYDGTGTQARINFEEQFARGGVGAIVSSHVPIHHHFRVLPNYATIERDDSIPFWRRLGETVHRYDCAYILQLSHAGRQQDIKGVENKYRKSQSASGRRDNFHGFSCQEMTHDDIRQTIRMFADGARRARQAGLDGIELHACNGYLFTQFLSAAINDRTDEYGGSLENRARFLLDVLRAIRREVGADFHVQVKISAVDHDNAMMFWGKPGNTLDDSIQVCRWLEEAGADALHISVGSFFPHPINPAGEFPLDHIADNYSSMIWEGRFTGRNYLLFRFRPLRPIARALWRRTAVGRPIEGANLSETRAIKRQVTIPVLATGGFQTASVIRAALDNGDCDGVTIARPLIANPDLVQQWAAGSDLPARPCTYCNKCLYNVLTNPMGCYEVSRYGNDYDTMMEHVMAVFQPSGFEDDVTAERLPHASA
jgi:2,4-dienoyl-CoA reductase-like NADH-dependent reductase (Old Yellow Enzyme family)